MAVNPWPPGDPRRPRPAPAADEGGATPLRPSPSPASRPVETAVGETVDAAFAVLAVAAAIGRYAVEVGVRVPRSAVRRLPVVGVPLPGQTGGWIAALGRVVAVPRSVAARALGVAADDLVPRVARAVLSRVDVPALVQEYVDVDRLAGQLDVNAVTARVDIDALLDRVDVEAIAAGLDLDALAEKIDIARILDRMDLDDVVDRVDLDRAVARVDIGLVLDRLDLDEIVARVDLDRAVARVDIGRVLDRVDLDEIVGRVDLDRAVGRVDLDRAVGRVDVDRILARTDIVGLARYVIDEIDLVALVRSSTGSVTTEMVRSVRDQSVDADRAVERVVDRLLRRSGRRAGQPPALAPGNDGAGR